MTDKTGLTDNFFAKLMNFFACYGFRIMVLRLAGSTHKEITATILHNFFFHFRNRNPGAQHQEIRSISAPNACNLSSICW